MYINIKFTKNKHTKSNIIYKSKKINVYGNMVYNEQVITLNRLT